MPIGSNPFVGSSRINNSGLFNRAMAIPKRCFIPIENCQALFRPVSCRSTILRTSPIRVLGISSNFTRTSKFSVAERFSYSGGVSIKAPICSRSLLLHSCPSNRILPLVGRSMPVIIFRVVDLPAPFGPSSPYIEPLRTVIDTLFTALCFLKSLHRLFVCRIASIFANTLSLFSR